MYVSSVGLVLSRCPYACWSISDVFFCGESCGDAWQSRAARLSHLVSFVGEPDAKAQILEPDRIMQLRRYVRAYTCKRKVNHRLLLFPSSLVLYEDLWLSSGSPVSVGARSALLGCVVPCCAPDAQTCLQWSPERLPKMALRRAFSTKNGLP